MEETLEQRAHWPRKAGGPLICYWRNASRSGRSVRKGNLEGPEYGPKRGTSRLGGVRSCLPIRSARQRFCSGWWPSRSSCTRRPAGVSFNLLHAKCGHDATHRCGAGGVFFAFRQRARAARRRISARVSAGTPCQRALPPFLAPSLDSAAACGFFLRAAMAPV